MGELPTAINLQFSNRAHSYEDLILFINRNIWTLQIMPRSLGSHSEISGT
jgi:hypothetical protein